MKRDKGMSFPTITIVAIVFLSVWQVASAEPAKEASMNTPRPRTRATAKITVQSSEAKPYDQSVSPALMEIRITEKFTGDIDGESAVDRKSTRLNSSHIPLSR